MSEYDFDKLQLFQCLSPEQRDQVRPLFVPCEFEPETVIFEQGEATKYLYLILEGEITIHFKPDDGPALIVARVRPEGIVGWSAALGSPSYTSAAITTTECHLLRVHGSDLRTLCEKYPETGALVLERLATVIAERLRNTHEHVIALLEQGLRVRNLPIAQSVK
jgi:CRP-like cAMP-binding protein